MFGRTMNDALIQSALLTHPVRPTSPLRMALMSTVALVAATVSSASADVIIDAPNGFAVRSNGAVSVGGAAQILGSLGAAGGSSIGWGATVTGSIENGSPHSWFTPQLGSMPSVGSQAINLGYQQSLSLAPGAYGAFTSNSQALLSLTAGQYVFSNFNLGYMGRVVADTSAGDVYLYVGNALSTGSETTFERTGPGNLFIVTGGSASFDYRTQVNGSLYSLGSQAFGSETRLNGLTWSGGSISVGYASVFNYAAPVPAPSALILLGATGALVLRRRRA